MSAFFDGSGIVTNYHLSVPESEWYTTKETDEIILFKDKDGLQRNVNDWIIFADDTNLLIKMILIREDETVSFETDVVPINAGDNWSNGKIRFQGIRVLGSAGQKVKYIGTFY